MSKAIDDLVTGAWHEHYDRIRPRGYILVDLALACSRCSGYRWYAKVTRGVGACGHGKHETPHEAVNRAVDDYEKNRKAWQPPAGRDGLRPLNMDKVIEE